MAGMPMRNINMLPRAKIAPAMPPPTASFDMLICGVEVSSLIVHLYYHAITDPQPRYCFFSV